MADRLVIAPTLPQVRPYRDEDAEAVTRFWHECFEVSLVQVLYAKKARRRQLLPTPNLAEW